MPETFFRFKAFNIKQQRCAMKINTDGVLLGAWVNVSGAKKILDIGTGSGVIAVMLAQRSSADKIVGVEIDRESAEEAEENFKESPWSDRLACIHAAVQDLQGSIDEPFDLIVSNPPFFTGGTLSGSQKKTLVRHTTKLSHTDLLRTSYSLLAEGGRLAVVLPYIEGHRFIELASQYRLYCERITEVCALPHKPVERLLITFSKKEGGKKIDQLVIRNAPDSFSKEYVALTQSFYLNM